MKLKRLEVSECTSRVEWYRKRIEDQCYYRISGNSMAIVPVDEVLVKFGVIKDVERRGRLELKYALGFAMEDWPLGGSVILPGEGLGESNLQLSVERKVQYETIASMLNDMDAALTWFEEWMTTTELVQKQRLKRQSGGDVLMLEVGLQACDVRDAFGRLKFKAAILNGYEYRRRLMERNCNW